MGKHLANSEVSRVTQVGRVLWGTLFLNLLVAVAKIVLGLSTGANSIMADGFHSLSDTGSNIVGLIGITVAARPRDDSHHYGHRKFETIASMVIAMFLGIAAIELLRGAFDRFFHPVLPQISNLAIGIMLVTLVINIVITLYERKRGQDLKSEILLADSQHTQSDVLTTVSVLIALFSIRAGFPIMDTIATLVIVGFIGFAAFRIFWASATILGDASLPIVHEVERIIREFPEVHDYHNIRTLGHPEEARVDLHVGLDPKLSNSQCHDLTHRIQDKIRGDIPSVKEVLIHVEPETGRC